MKIPYKNNEKGMCLNQCFIYENIGIHSASCVECKFYGGSSDTVVKCNVDTEIEKYKYNREIK